MSTTASPVIPRGHRPADPAEPDPLGVLADRALRGEEGALERLAERVRPRVYRWALARTGHPDDAEDVTQEAVLALARRLSDFDGRARFATWLYAVTRNAAADLHRHRERRSRLRDEALREAAAEAATRGRPDPGADLDRARLTELVMGFLADLPERQREVFDLCELQGHTSTEVAEMLDIEAVSVRGSLLKARRRIRRRILESHGEWVEDR